MRNSQLKRSSKRIPKQSKKFRKRAAEVKPARVAFILLIGFCEICGCSDIELLCVHEITNGPDRQDALDKRSCTLVLCFYCNGQVVTNKAVWPIARQAAVILVNRPDDFDLVELNNVRNRNAPNATTLPDVQVYVPTVRRYAA